MAKARIVYQVEDKELDALQKQLDKIKKSNKEVEDSFKGSNEEIKKGGGALNDLKGTIAGLGLAAVATKAVVEFAKLTQEVNKNRKEVALLTNETGKALDNITAKVRATSQVFNKDFNEVLRAANTLSKEFNVSMTDAIDEINEGFTRGLDINGDYLDTLREYSTFIKEAGLNTRQFNVLIQQQVQQGIFSDKGIDAIKEAVISIREMTPATKDAIKAIGIDTNQLVKDIQSGTVTYFEAVQQIATKTRELADPQKTGQILADVFRGAGEDAGNFVFTLDQVTGSFGEADEAQQKYIKNQQDLLRSSEDLNEELIKFSDNFDNVSNVMTAFLNDVGAGTLRFIDDLFNGFDNVDKKTKSLRDSFSTLTLDERNSELQSLTEQSNKLATEIERLEGENKDKGFFGRLFGSGNPERLENLKDQLGEINLQIGVLNELSKESNTIVNEEVEVRKAAAKATDDQIVKLNDLTRQNLESKESEFIQDVERRAERNETIKNIEGKLADDLVEINKRKNEQIEIDDSESIERRRELIQTSIDGFLDILGSFNELRIQQINNELQANELARNRELELAEGNATKQAEINKKFDSEQAKLRTKQVNAQKQAQLFSAIVNTARAVVESLPNIPLSILVGALGAAQIGFIAAQQPPKFAKGIIDLKGPGTSTSDSIPAYLSRGESVMTAEETRDFMPTLKAIRSREIKPEIINRIVADKLGPNITVNDYDKLAEAVINQPKFNMNMDENGFSVYMQRQMSSLSIKQSKYRM